MKIIVSGRNLELTEAIKERVTDKMEKLFEHFDFVKEVHVFLSVEKNPSIKENQLAEATIHMSGNIIRVSVSTENLYTSIDNLEKKAFRSLRKNKSKLLKRTKHAAAGDSIRKPDPEYHDDLLSEADLEDVDDEVFTTLTSESETVGVS